MSETAQSFGGLVLRYRQRTSLTQRELASRLGLNARMVRDWEAGLTYPTATGLKGLIAALFEAGGLRRGSEAADVRALWTAVEREAPYMRSPVDNAWLAQLLGPGADAGPVRTGSEVRGHDWGDAPSTADFVGRAEHTFSAESGTEPFDLRNMAGS
jgi:transcriptional regulator with XRE-family HTH domain